MNDVRDRMKTKTEILQGSINRSMNAIDSFHRDNYLNLLTEEVMSQDT